MPDNMLQFNKKTRYDYLYLDIAQCITKMSFDRHTKVGAIIVKDNNILAFGFNGMPAGMDNECKDSKGKTKPEVIHAEANAICKVARTTGSCEGATIYCTHAPCIECCKLILQSGIKRVVYKHAHLQSWFENSPDVLRENNIEVDHLT
mgnify:CR=1 FL=1